MRREDGETLKFTLNSQERNMIKNGRFDNYLNPVYGIECERGHWSEGRGNPVENRKGTIWKVNRNDCPDYLEVNYQRDLPASRRTLENKNQKKKVHRNRVFEISLVIFTAILTFTTTVLFSDQIKNFLIKLFSE